MAYLLPTVFGAGVYVNLVEHPSRLEALAAAWTVGWAAVNLVSFIANQYLLIPFQGIFYGVVSLGLGFAGLTLLVRRRDRITQLAREPLPRIEGPLELVFVGLIAAFIAFVLYKALIVFPVHPDELIYHMELPKVAWQTGFLPLQPGLDLVSQGTAYPDLLVTQQVWIYLGAGAFDPNLVRLIMPIYTALLILVVYSDARRWFGLVPAGLATAALLSLFSFTSLTFLMMDEVPVALYSMLGLHFALQSYQDQRTPYLAGLWLGFASLVKYDALAGLLALGLALLVMSRWKLPRREGQTSPATGKMSLRWGIGYFSMAIPSTLPVLVRNLVRLGNPVYPYFFGGVSNQLNSSLLASVNMPMVVGELLNSEAVSLLATVLVAALLLGFLRYRKWTGPERLLLLFVAFYLPPYLAVPLLGSQIRYLAPILPAMALFASRQVTGWLWETQGRTRWAGAGLLLGILGITSGLVAWGSFYSGFSRQGAAMTVEVFAISSAAVLLLAAIASRRPASGPRKVVVVALVLVLLTPGVIAIADEKSEADPLGWTPYLLPLRRDTYLSAKLGADWAMWTWMNENLGANVSVLSFEPRVFYIEARVVNALSPEIMPTYNMTLAEAVSFLRVRNVDFVLDSGFGDGLFLNYLYVDSSPIFQNLNDAAFFSLLHQEGPNRLYAVV